MTELPPPVPKPDTEHAYPCDRCSTVHHLYRRWPELLCPACTGGSVAYAYQRLAAWHTQRGEP